MDSKRTIRTVFLLGLVFLASFSLSAALAAQPIGSTTTRPLVKREFTDWSYVATEQDSMVVLAIELPDQGRTALNRYARASHSLAPELFAQQEFVQATVVFERPLTTDRLPALILEAREQITEFSFRVRGGQNERITVFGVPGSNQLVEPDQLTSILKEIEVKMGRADLRGMTNLTMTLNEAQYQILKDSSAVRLVDLIPAAAKADYERNPSLDGAATQISVIPAAIFWYHESLDGA
jgi:hypothetical protein